MEDPIYHNKLLALKDMGFSITWSLIEDGLNFSEEMGVDFDFSEMFIFLKTFLGKSATNDDEIIQIICCEDDDFSLKKQLQTFANRENKDQNLNLRKWRAIMLQEKLCNSITTLIDLYVFWLTYPMTHPIPCFYPHNSAEFFSKKIETVIREQKEWLRDEVEEIISIDKSMSIC